MNISIFVPDEVVSKLEKRAAASGQSLPAYTSKLVTDSVTKPTLDEILAPVREDFANSGMTEKELLDLGRSALNAVRQEKKAKTA